MRERPQKTVLINQIPDMDNGVKATKSSHDVSRVKVKIDKNTEVDAFFKKCVGNYTPELAQYECAMSGIGRLAIGDRIADIRLVYDLDNQIVGAVSLAIPEFKDMYTDAPDLEQLIKFEAAYALVFSYFFEDMDVHPGNIGAGYSKQLKKQVIFRIDLDECFSPEIYKFKGERIVGGKYSSESFPITSEDIINFPILNKAVPIFWVVPTNYRHEYQSYLLADKKYLNENEFRKLATAPEFIDQKFHAFLKIASLSEEMMRHALQMRCGNDEINSKIINHFMPRIDILKNTLIGMPEFQDFFLRKFDIKFTLAEEAGQYRVLESEITSENITNNDSLAVLQNCNQIRKACFAADIASFINNISTMYRYNNDIKAMCVAFEENVIEQSMLLSNINFRDTALPAVNIKNDSSSTISAEINEFSKNIELWLKDNDQAFLDEKFIDSYRFACAKLSSLSNELEGNNKQTYENCCNILYTKMISWVTGNNKPTSQDVSMQQTIFNDEYSWEKVFSIALLRWIADANDDELIIEALSNSCDEYKPYQCYGLNPSEYTKTRWEEAGKKVQEIKELSKSKLSATLEINKLIKELTSEGKWNQRSYILSYFGSTPSLNVLIIKNMCLKLIECLDKKGKYFADTYVTNMHRALEDFRKGIITIEGIERSAEEIHHELFPYFDEPRLKNVI